MNWSDDERITQIETLVPPKVSPSESSPRDRGVLTVLNGPLRSLCFRVGEGVVVGRGKEAQALLPHPALSRNHARVYRGTDGFFIADLGSKNGTYVADQQVTGPVRISDGARIRLGAQVFLRFAVLDEVEEQATLDLHQSALTDPLTRAYNRAVMYDRLEGEWAFAKRHRVPLSVMMLDVDHFKKLNDEHGHQAGDAVLRMVAASIQRVIRREDLLARYGGEEFVVVARGTSLTNGVIMAERIRQRISTLKIPWQGRQIRLTISAGVSALEDGARYASVQELLAAADSALFAAKANGRNRVVRA